MDNMKKLLYLTIGYYFLSALYVHAATLSVTTPATTAVGDRISVDVVVHLSGETINSAEGVLRCDLEHLRFDGYDRSASALLLWVTPPSLENGVVHFSGVTPGGVGRTYDPQHPYSQAVTLARLFFVATSPGTAGCDPTGTTLLANDGKGTSLEFTTTSSSTIIGPATTTAPLDTTPPAPFTITLMDASPLGKTPRLALFAADTSGEGIEHYEVSVAGRAWHRTTSPFPLPNRMGSYELRVRAFDFAGNYQEQSITVPGQRQLVLIGILCLLCIAFFIKRSRI